VSASLVLCGDRVAAELMSQCGPPSFFSVVAVYFTDRPQPVFNALTVQSLHRTQIWHVGEWHLLRWRTA